MYLAAGALSAPTFEAVMKLVRSGFVDLTRLISRTYPAEGAEEAFRDMDHDSAQIIKAVFEF